MKTLTVKILDECMRVPVLESKRTIIDNYAHDYRDIEMSEVQLVTMLLSFLSEIRGLDDNS